MINKPEKLLLTIKEACEVLSIKRTHFYQLPIMTVRVGKSGRSTRVPYKALEAYVKSISPRDL